MVCWGSWPANLEPFRLGAFRNHMQMDMVDLLGMGMDVSVGVGIGRAMEMCKYETKFSFEQVF